MKWLNYRGPEISMPGKKNKKFFQKGTRGHNPIGVCILGENVVKNQGRKGRETFRLHSVRSKRNFQGSKKNHGFHCYASHQKPGNLNKSAAVHLLLFLAPPGIISGLQDLGRHSNNLLPAIHKPRATLGCVWSRGADNWLEYSEKPIPNPANPRLHDRSEWVKKRDSVGGKGFP